MIRFPPEKIMVPFDFTEPSLAAWRLARTWARRFKARLDVAYVEDMIPAESWDWRRRHGMNAGLKQNILAHLRDTVGDVPRLHVAEGDPASRLLGLTKTINPDLIIMGTRGRTGLERFLRGSVAETLARLSPVPVLALREQAGVAGPVLAPVSFTARAEYGLRYAAGVAAALDKPLTAAHIAGDGEHGPGAEFRVKNLITRLREDVRGRCRYKVIAAPGSVTGGILAASRGCGLVVLVARRKSLLEDLVSGGLVERLVRHSTVPVLAVPEPKSVFLWERWVESGRLHPAAA